MRAKASCTMRLASCTVPCSRDSCSSARRCCSTCSVFSCWASAGLRAPAGPLGTPCTQPTQTPLVWPDWGKAGPSWYLFSQLGLQHLQLCPAALLLVSERVLQLLQLSLQSCHLVPVLLCCLAQPVPLLLQAGNLSVLFCSYLGGHETAVRAVPRANPPVWGLILDPGLGHPNHPCWVHHGLHKHSSPHRAALMILPGDNQGPWRVFSILSVKMHFYHDCHHHDEGVVLPLPHPILLLSLPTS